jgi:acyl-CoA oxidase
MSSSAIPSTFKQQWGNHVSDIRSNVTPEQSANRLRTLLKTKLLEFHDLSHNPEKFFLAHRMMVDPKNRGPGMFIRFTVQFNLYAGSVLGLGSPTQIAQLRDQQEKGELGCFALTEKLAGVNSGLVVQTTATYDAKKQIFVLHSPTVGSHKNWISQGLFADHAVVIADLWVEGRSHGPHGFLIRMREAGTKKVVKGIVLGDMGIKTTGNDLDNAWIEFNQVELPRTALLSRFAEIDAQTGKYIQTTKDKMRIEIIGQRLLTGRVCVAQAALSFARKLFDMTRTYSDTKLCWSPNGEIPLTKIPHLQKLYHDAYMKLDRLDEYCGRIEARLCKILQQNGIPDTKLVDAIAVAKINAVENAIDLSLRLKREVGSYALMGGTGFEHVDFLYCCSFAEGDSRILMQKLARDRLKNFSSEKPSSLNMNTNKEVQLCVKLQSAGKNGWDKEFETVYALANTIIERTMDEVLSSGSLNGKL